MSENPKSTELEKTERINNVIKHGGSEIGKAAFMFLPFGDLVIRLNEYLFPKSNLSHETTISVN